MSTRRGQDGDGRRPAGGFTPSRYHDLKHRGGRTLSHLKYYTLYLGRAADWNPDDRQRMDTALELAMTDRHLNNVLVQYFPSGEITTTFLGSRIDGQPLDGSVNLDSVSEILRERCDTIDGYDPMNTVVNLALPRGVGLRDDRRGGQRRHERRREKEDTSLNGLMGGYHGSFDLSARGHRWTAYYAISAYNSTLPAGDNGIVHFRDPWKNNVCVMYHELCEARSDPDVDDSRKQQGWTDRYGNEIGDYPMDEAGADLGKVMVEVPLTSGRGTVPVQLQYSNYVHGPEGPATTPRPFTG